MQTLEELVKYWKTPEGKPFKGELVDLKAYKAEPSLSCMCAQGQVLHVLAGKTAKELDQLETDQADDEVANLLNISISHAILLRVVNDSMPGAPGSVLTNPARHLGANWSKVLDLWMWLDHNFHTLDVPAWTSIVSAQFQIAQVRAEHCLPGVELRRLFSATSVSNAHVAGALYEIIAYLSPEPPFFLPRLGFETSEAIPARPDNYGIPNVPAQ